MKRKLLFIVFLFNILVTCSYILLKYAGYVKISKIEFSLLLIYDIISLVIFGELLHDEEKKINQKD